MNLNEQGPNFNYKKGNIDMNVYKSERPINKESVDEHILDYLYLKAGENADLLKISDFSIEFILFKNVKGFVKFNIESGNKVQTEILFAGKDLDNLIEVIQNYGSGLEISEN